MNSSKNESNWFDDNFEVTYEDDHLIDSDFSTKNQKNKSKRKIDLSIPTESLDSQPAFSDYEDTYEDNAYADDEYDHDSDYRSDPYDSPRSNLSKKRRKGPTRLAAPLQKGSNLLYKVSKSVLRNLTLILILAIIVMMAYNFFKASTPYGDIENAVSSRSISMTLAGYSAVALLFILFELISLLWATTTVRVRDQFGVYREDIGRGKNSFIFIYICSYAAFLFNRFIPESMEVLIGIKGALDVFGSLHNALFGVCVAGVISCLIRKYR